MFRVTAFETSLFCVHRNDFSEDGERQRLLCNMVARRSWRPGFTTQTTFGLGFIGLASCYSFWFWFHLQVKVSLRWLHLLVTVEATMAQARHVVFFTQGFRTYLSLVLVFCKWFALFLAVLDVCLRRSPIWSLLMSTVVSQ